MINRLMSLKASVKITLIICFFFLIAMFMYFTWEAGLWEQLLRWMLEAITPEVKE